MEARLMKEEELLFDDDNLVMLGCFDEKCVGYIGIIDFQKIKYFYIDEKYQDTHIGNQLIQQAQLLMHDDMQAIVSSDMKEIFMQNGFQYVSQEKENVILSYTCSHENTFQTYDQVHDFIASQKKRVYALDHFQRFMHDLCNPQLLLKTIHIGGTNGKGSSTNYIRSVLQKAGYKVGTFTSPVLETRLEIMRIQNNHIQEENIIQYANRYISLWLEYELSMFEIEVFIAIMYFLHEHVDFAIFEVGLGGELDATNIIHPLIAGITNIGLDHTEYLGHTYQEIAKTKGGIIKDKIPFVTGEKRKECLDILENLCQRHQSPFIKVKPISHIQTTTNGISYDYQNFHVSLNNQAIYQVENSAFAIEMLSYLRMHQYIQVTDNQLLQGIKEAIWLGRFETVCHHPLMIIDGAHNKEGIDAFLQSAKKYPHIKIIFSALRDKDTHGMIEKLLTLTDDVTICEFDFYRAQSAIKLAEDFPVHIEKDWKKAIDEAFSHQGTVFITGSLYFISQVRPYILAKSQK